MNPRLLGQNVQWVDRGDGLVDAEGRFEPGRLALARAMSPAVLRYPGGSNTDTYHWQAGRGPIASRGTSEHFHTKEAQPVLFGTGEFLRLCRELGAEPLISVNTASGSAEEAGAWAAAIAAGEFVDDAGRPLGPVAWWEIGNEPYLREDAHPELAVEPAESARRMDAAIAALRAVDPHAKVGIPLRHDTLGTIGAVAFPGYAETVLGALTQPFDFVALHDTYMPFLLLSGADAPPQDVFAATMAASRAVEADLQATRNLLARMRPGQRVPLAITELNALFTLGGPLDEAVTGIAGALFVADVLISLAQAEDVLMANYWSLSGNWVFGAIAQDGAPRVAHFLYVLLAQGWKGELLAAEVSAPSFDSPAVGIVPAYAGTPLVRALATRDGDMLRVRLINKDWSRSARLTIAMRSDGGGAARAAAATATVLSSDDPFRSLDASAASAMQSLPVEGADFPLLVVLPPRSFAFVDVVLGGSR